jgi:hypothetical protein
VPTQIFASLQFVRRYGLDQAATGRANERRLAEMTISDHF